MHFHVLLYAVVRTASLVLMPLMNIFGACLQSQQIAELLGIIQQQSSHLEQYRAVLDAQRESNTNLNADCERIQARYSIDYSLVVLGSEST